MYSFRATVRVGGDDVAAGEPVEIGGQLFRSLAPSPQQMRRPFPFSFEDASAAMTELDRMFTEPDGSFVWKGAEPDPWQVEGNLFDVAGRLLFVELWGRCPQMAFDRLLQCFHWPDVQLMFYCDREGICLDESEFRRFAASGASSAHWNRPA